MKAVTPHPPASSEDAVHALRDADGKSLKAARERAAIQCLNDEMHVIALNGEVQNAQAAVRCPRQAMPDGGKERLRAQRRQPLRGPQRDMHRVARIVGGARSVRDADLPPRRLSPGAPTLPSPCSRAELQLDRKLPHDLNEAGIATC